MAKTRSWSVKGIDGETRDLAREAARASGMTIGAWIDQAILKAKHGELPDISPASAPASGPEGSPAGRAAASGSAQASLPLSPAPETSPAVPAVSPEISPAPSHAESMDAAPIAVEEAQDDIELPPDDLVADREFVAGQPSDGHRPSAPPPAPRQGPRYAILGIVFAAILGGGGWLFVELSSPNRTPAPQKIADAAPAVEAPPPPPAAASTTTPVAPAPSAASTPAASTPAASAPPASTPAASTSTTGPVADGLPAGLPDAIRRVVGKARAGDPKAQYEFGMLYLSGRLGDKNPAEAAKWFERAAEQGAANAQFNLGVLYQRGEGVAQNDKLAFFWFQSAAEQNYPPAQHNLATAYAAGRGISRNYPKAAEWFTKSAGAGLSQSQYSLAALHERGLITGRPNAVEARRWYERALAQGDTRASVRLAALDTPATAAAATLDRAEIRQIQTLLSRMSFNPGPADGQMGKRTADAIRLYQKFAGMDEDGAPSRELLEDLRAVAETMAKNG